MNLCKKEKHSRNKRVEDNSNAWKIIYSSEMNSSNVSEEEIIRELRKIVKTKVTCAIIKAKRR